MAKHNRHQSEKELFGRCEICMENIPIEYYFNNGDEITCYECGTEYLILSKSPVKLSIQEFCHDPDDLFGGVIFDD